jgi:hypothetical protein
MACKNQQIQMEGGKNYFSHKIAQIYGVQEKCEN